ncbi:MAG: protein translocase subunit SecD [Planctomycetota bacterium]
MVANFRIKALLTTLLLVAAVVLILIKPMTLGLDLAGGTYLRYSVADALKKVGAVQGEDPLQSVMDILRARVDNLGIKETTIRSQGADEIIVELPGSSEAEAVGVQKVIESQGRLEFRLQAYDEPGIDPEAMRKQLDDYLNKLPEAERGNRNLDLSKLTENVHSKQASYRWLPMSERYMRGHYGKNYDPKRIDWVLVKQDPAYDLNGGDLENVYPGDDAGKPAVAFAIKAQKAPVMGKFTRENMHRGIVVVLDGEVESVAEIQGEITDHGQINGGSQGFTQDEVKHLMTVLKSGALPLKPALQSRNQIGPSLGEDSIRMGKLSSIASMLIVVVFMILYYRASGVIACLALVANILLVFAVLALLQATLTLPGIAGIALTMGMAVDANILIHERMREERERGKSTLQAAKLGFERAFATVVDSNLTTFIAGYILYYCGSGPIRGFAVTLMLGIMTTLFTALAVSKLLFHWLIERGWLKELKMLKLVPETNVPFTRYVNVCLVISGIVIVGGLALFFDMGKDKYGLDFTGGYKATIQIAEAREQSEMRGLVNEVYPGAEVVSVGGEGGKSTIFQIKIKKFLEEQSAAGGAAEPAASTSGESLTKPVEAAKATESTEVIKLGLRNKLGNLLVVEPITDLKVEVDTQNSQSKVSFKINYSAPVAKTIVERNAKDFLHDVTIDGPDSAQSFGVAGTFNVAATEDVVRARAVTAMKYGLPRTTVNGHDVLITESQPFIESDLIGPRVGSELRDKAIIALFLSFVATVIYVRVRFHGYSWGIAATLALVHDVFTTVAALCAVRFLGVVNVEFDLTTVAVLLTIVGYSINDTIVVFDRIRENLPRMNRPFTEVVDISVNQTLSRTLLTSLTVFLTSLVIFVLNYGKGNVLESFSFGMLFGVITGTYSSVYIASPLVIWIVKRSKRAHAAVMAGAGSTT